MDEMNPFLAAIPCFPSHPVNQISSLIDPTLLCELIFVVQQDIYIEELFILSSARKVFWIE